MASAIESEASRSGRSASALVAEATGQYLKNLRTSKLGDWVGKGRSQGSGANDVHEQLAEVLERKHRRTNTEGKR